MVSIATHDIRRRKNFVCTSDGNLREGAGAEHASTLIGMGNLGSTYSGQGRWKQTEDLEVQVTEMSKKA